MSRFFRIAILAIGALCCGYAAADEKSATDPNPDPHAAVFAQTLYPSATQCAGCHQRIFTEWSSSNHAYAAVSPMFHKFEQSITGLTTGTIGTFCVRCHQQVGTQRGEPREQALWERSLISREGVTCITCHRVSADFGKVNGERHIDPAPMDAPVYGGGRAQNLADVQAHPDDFGLFTADNPNGRRIHQGAVKFTPITNSEFCVSCHQVAVNLGIKLEVVWDQYRASPAAARGVQCQECHMGKTPGRPDGFEQTPIAIVNGRVVGDGLSRHSNHAFFGPGYPIAHPGLFPFNPRALEWTIEDWLKFDYRAGWGTREYEEKHAGDATEYPEVWKTRDVREKARIVIEQNQQSLDYKRHTRLAVMENGSAIDGPFFSRKPAVNQGLSLTYKIRNTDEGHNLPSGSLGAQPEIWFNVALVDPEGRNVWESGYVDSTGDMADLHSAEVRDGKLPLDLQLLNFQAKFLTTNVKGTDREMYLPVNFDGDQLPFLRPSGTPASVLNHPPFVRMEQRSIPPLGERDADYSIPASAFAKPGKYKLLARLRSRAEPIYFMKFVGATKDMEQAINEWMIDIHPYAVEFEVN